MVVEVFSGTSPEYRLPAERRAKFLPFQLKSMGCQLFRKSCPDPNSVHMIDAPIQAHYYILLELLVQYCILFYDKVHRSLGLWSTNPFKHVLNFKHTNDYMPALKHMLEGLGPGLSDSFPSRSFCPSPWMDCVWLDECAFPTMHFVNFRLQWRWHIYTIYNKNYTNPPCPQLLLPLPLLSLHA